MRLYAVANKHGALVSFEWHYSPQECVPLVTDGPLAARCARVVGGKVVEFVPEAELEELRAQNTALQAEINKLKAGVAAMLPGKQAIQSRAASLGPHWKEYK